MKNGFTLIELSIVLVIIGLIVGGVLVGQDLINAAAIRAQISQIEKYQTAVHTFQNKYGYLPGDIPAPYASNFGFQARGAYAGEGDGNGVIEGNCSNDNSWIDGTQQGCGELAVFWQDLSTANLINAKILTGVNYPNISAPMTGDCCALQGGTPELKNWLPIAKLGSQNFVYVFSFNGENYFSLSQVYDIGWAIESTSIPGSGNPGLTVQQAYNIDSKIDDGLPQSGSVTACYLDWDVVNNQQIWAAGNGNTGAGGAYCVSSTGAAAYHSYNCYDNGGVAGTQKYSVKQNANLQNCALSFRFQ